MDAGSLTTSSFSMAAESLSPVALNSNTLATGPLQPRHLEGVKTVAVRQLSPSLLLKTVQFETFGLNYMLLILIYCMVFLV